MDNETNGMIDVGKTPPKGLEAPSPVGGDGKKYYPSLNLEVIPEAMKDKPVGHICRLNVLVKVRGISDDERGRRMDLEVRKVGYASSGKKTKEEYVKMSEKEREDHDRSSLEESDDEETKGAE